MLVYNIHMEKIQTERLFKMKKELYKTEKIIADESDSGEAVIEYYVTQSEHPFKSGGISYVCYGVEIRMVGEGAASEVESADEIFFLKEKAEEFVSLLAKERVTPCSLCEIVSDKLKEALI